MSERASLAREQREYYRRHPLFGRHPITLGALALLGLSGYELWVRLEDFWAWTAGIRHLSQKRGTPFMEDLAIVFEAPEMRQLGYKMLFLALAIVFAGVCLLRRNRPGGAWALLAVGVALAGFGLWLGIYAVSNWTQWVKLAPLALICSGMAGNRVQRRIRHRRRHQHSHHAEIEA